MDKLSPALLAVITAQSLALLGFIAREIYRHVKKTTGDNRSSITSIEKNFQKIEIFMEFMKKDVDRIPKMREDIQAAHNKIRLLEKSNVQLRK